MASSPGLPTEVRSGGQNPTGTGQSPALELAAGDEATALPPRPVRAKQFDAEFDHGVIAEGQMDGETDPKGDIPWL